MMSNSFKDSLRSSQKILRAASVLILAVAMIIGTFAVPDLAFADEDINVEIGEPISIPMESDTLSIDRDGEQETLKIEVYQDYTKAYEVLSLVNTERQKAGVAPLVMDESLLESAMHRASETVVLWSHGRPDGTLCFTINSQMRAENIAWGATTSQSVMNGWMNSEGHRANILNASYKGVGIGVVKYNGAYYWVQCFGTTSQTTNCAKPSDGNSVRAINMPYNTFVDPYKNITVTYNFSITPSRKTLLMGESRDLTLVMDSVTFLDGEDSVYWRSSDETVASIDSDGVVTGLAPGNVVITASSKTLDRKSFTLNITITPENVRIYGKNRFVTAIEAAKKLKAKLGVEKFDAMIIASGGNYADALSGSWLSAAKSAPMLLVDLKNEDTVAQYIIDNLSEEGTVYILGGEKAVSVSMEEKLEGINTKRLEGKSRYDTNLAILNEIDTTGKDLLVCSGQGYADALSVSSVGRPILLVKGSLTDEQKAYLETADFDTAYVIGGVEAVSQDLRNSVAEYVPSVTRVGGKNRYETSLKVANKFFPGHHDYMMMVYAMDFPDGLSGGALAYQYDAPVILATSSDTSAASSYRSTSGAARSITMGGPKLISDNAIFVAMGNTTPIQVN